MILQFRNIALLLFSFLSLNIFAQVEVNSKITLTGVDSSLRQIKQLASPKDTTAAVRAVSYQNGSLIYAQATGADSLTVTLTPSISSYTPGTIINFIAQQTNDSAVYLNVNNIGYSPIFKDVNLPLDSADIYSGQLVSVVFDGVAFQVISELNHRCPSGMVEVAPRYCIEINEHTAQTFWDAAVTCFDENARMCDWGEWYQACIDSGLGLIGMLNNWEWVDSAVNYYTSINQSAVRTVGLGSCEQGNNGDPIASVLWTFRCCYSK